MAARSTHHQQRSEHIDDLPVDDIAQTPLVCAAFNIRKASRAISQFYDDMLQPAGIRGTQYSLLVAILFAGDVGIGSLSQGLVTDRTTLSRNLKILVDQGLIEKAAGEDRRRRAYRLTKQGEAALKRAYPLWQKAQERVMTELGVERFGELKKMTDQVVALARDEPA